MSTTTSAPDPYGFNSQCNTDNSDTQLMTDTFANIINSTFTFRCCGSFFGCVDQPGPTFHSCGDDFSIGTQNLDLYPSLTFCIGGTFEQHACAGSGCQQIDRTATISKQCPQQLLDYMKVQPAGTQFSCCDASSCAIGTDYTCPTSRSLQLCIGDGTGAQCINPVNLAICSGNFSTAVGSGSSTQQNPDAAQVPNTTQITAPSESSAASHSGLGPSDVATIAGSTLGALTSAVGLWLGYRKMKKRKQRREESKERSAEDQPSEEVSL